MIEKTQQTVFCFIISNNKILLLERINTWFENNKYCPPGGNVDANETPKDAAIRETFEETNLQVKYEDLTLLKQFTSEVNSKKFDNYYYITYNYNGTPVNKEPERHSTLSWYDIAKLPSNTSDLVVQTLNELTT